MAFEKYFLPGADEPKMAIHLFVAILSENIAVDGVPPESRKSEAECIAALEARLGVTLTAEESQDITDTIALVNAGSGASGKKTILDEIYRVATLAEHGTWYNTVELMRTRLNWSTPV